MFRVKFYFDDNSHKCSHEFNRYEQADQFLCYIMPIGQVHLFTGAQIEEKISDEIDWMRYLRVACVLVRMSSQWSSLITRSPSSEGFFFCPYLY